MPFLGHSSGSTSGEKSGGKKWTKTQSGWRPIEQTAGKPKETSKEVTVKNLQDRKSEVKKILESSFVKYSKRRQGTSRESSSYNSIGQAMSQMHFVVATENIKCHTFIMQILRLLSEEKVYPRLSGSAQSYLQSMLESLVNYVIRTEDNHSNLVVCINDIIYNHKQICRNSYNDHCKKQSHFQLKKIERHKATLMHYIENKYTREISCHIFSLPDDCLRQIIVLVQVPADVFNLGRTCRMCWSLVYDSRMWRELLRTYAYSHYTELMCSYSYCIQIDVPIQVAINAYRSWYNEVFAKMDHSPRIIQLCTICEFMYWEGSFHPCIYKTNYPKANSSIPITAKQFVELYL